MSSQLTLNQFDALTLAEKLEIFGRDLFTTKQFNLIQAVIDFDCYGERFVKVCDLLKVSKASLSGVISSLNYCGVVYTHKTFNQNIFKNVLFSAKILDCILYTHFIDLYTNSYIETSAQEITEKTPAQEITEKTAAQEITEKTAAHSLTCQVNLWNLVKDCPTISTRQINKMGYKTAQGTKWDKESLELLKNLVLHDNVEALCTCKETPAQKNTPKRLKPATLKNYSAKQLAKHLDRLQDVFIDSEKDALYRVEHGAVYVYEADDNAYYFYGKTRESSLSAISHTYRALGI